MFKFESLANSFTSGNVFQCEEVIQANVIVWGHGQLCTVWFYGVTESKDYNIVVIVVSQCEIPNITGIVRGWYVKG
jgi:hypothetical protein